MLTIKKIVTPLLLLCLAGVALAQKPFAFSQHEQNRYNYIPATAGFDDAYRVGGAAHLQSHTDSLAWQALAINFSGPLNMQPFSLGVGVANEQNDLYLFGSAQATGAYLLEKWNSRISFALSLGYARYEFTGWGLKSQAGDTLSNGKQYIPDLGASVFFSHGVFYAGLAIQHIGNFKLDLTPNGEYIGNRLQQQIYVLAGAAVVLPEVDLTLQPSVLFNYMGDELNASASVMLGWKDLIWLGASGKTTHQAGFIAGINIAKRYMLSYSCDFGLGTSAQPIAHEIALGVKFEKLRKK